VHKLLFDNNISHRVISRVSDIFPNTSHVMLENLDEATDIRVWRFARQNGYTIVTKDSDFNDLAIYQGSPPKVIWLKIGNCRVAKIAQILIDNREIIKTFLDNPDSSILEI